MSSETQLYLQGFVNINDQDWSRKAILGNPGTGVYGSGSDCGVYAIIGDQAVSASSYGLKALQGYGTGAIFSQGAVHHMDGNVGIGTQTPKERLEVEGAIKIGSRGNAGAAAGTVRWNAKRVKLQVFDGSQWIDLH
jgi:hypothetical protein